jgi:hypothetical protein
LLIILAFALAAAAVGYGLAIWRDFNSKGLSVKFSDTLAALLGF